MSTCTICDGPMPPRKTKRGPAPKYCSDACRKKRNALRKAEQREQQRAEEEAALRADIEKLAAHYREIVAVVELIFTLEHMPTPGAFDWHLRVKPHIDASEAITYRRIWQTAASRTERIRADRGADVRLDAYRLEDAALVLAERDVKAARMPYALKTPRALLIDPNFRQPDAEAKRRQPFKAVPASEMVTGGEDGDMPTPMYGRAEGYYVDDYGSFEADPARRTAPKVRLAKWEDDA